MIDKTNEGGKTAFVKLKSMEPKIHMNMLHCPIERGMTHKETEHSFKCTAPSHKAQ